MHFKLELILKEHLHKEFEIRLEEPEFPNLSLRFKVVSDEKDKRYGNHLCTIFTDLSLSPNIVGLLENPSKPFPKDVREFADDLEGRLTDTGLRAFKLLRWYRGSSDDDNPIGAVKELAYSPDAVHWQK